MHGVVVAAVAITSYLRPKQNDISKYRKMMSRIYILHEVLTCKHLFNTNPTVIMVYIYAYCTVA